MLHSSFHGRAGSAAGRLAARLAGWVVAVPGLLLCASAAAQFVDHDKVRCEPVPKEEKRPQMELQETLVAEGWRVRQVKDFNGCYEVYGFDEKGQRREAFFDPKTFRMVGEIRLRQ